MERAYVLPEAEADWPPDTDRLYFGAEFCCWALPSAEAIASVWDRARSVGLPLTLMLPVLVESFLPRLEAVIDAIRDFPRSGDEVAISDWGALDLLRERLPEVPLVLGRTLSGQKRGPQILALQLNDAERDYFRQGNWYGREATTLLAEEGIGRIELDNLLQGLAPVPSLLKASLHHPFAMVTSSRNCPYHSVLPTAGCGVPCQRAFTLTSPRSPLPLLQRGNTQFIRHDRVPEDLAALGVDRLVFHPRLPR